MTPYILAAFFLAFLGVLADQWARSGRLNESALVQSGLAWTSRDARIALEGVVDSFVEAASVAFDPSAPPDPCTQLYEVAADALTHRGTSASSALVTRADLLFSRPVEPLVVVQQLHAAAPLPVLDRLRSPRTLRLDRCRVRGSSPAN